MNVPAASHKPPLHMACAIVPKNGRRGRSRSAELASLALVGMLLLSGASLAAVAPPLGTSQSFAVLGATPNVNNTGPTIVTGDLGVSHSPDRPDPVL